MAEGGSTINERWYSQHALERMAPDTPAVRAELNSRAIQSAKSQGLQPGTKAYSNFIDKCVDPRGIPPTVIEDAVKNGRRTAGNSSGTWVYKTQDVTVITNNTGGVVTVIPR